MPGRREWQGMRKAESGDEVGLLLDLDEFTLSVYLNGARLGVMAGGTAGQAIVGQGPMHSCHQEEGFRWAVSMGFVGDQVRVRSDGMNPATTQPCPD